MIVVRRSVNSRRVNNKRTNLPSFPLGIMGSRDGDLKKLACI
jgi:hypothetical protein